MMRTLLLLSAVLSAAPAWAARWDTYNNANRLNSVRAVSGAVWAASDLGLHRYDPATNRFTRVAKSSGGLASNSIDEVEVDATGTWFATRGRGVSVELANGAWRTLTTFDGLPSDTVTALEPSPQGMWVATRRGLALFEGLSLAAVWPDGVNPSPFASDVINDVAHVGDSTYVATNNGVYVTKTSEGVTWLRRVNGLGGTLTINAIKGVGNEVWCLAGTDLYRGGQLGTWTLDETGLGSTTVATLTGRDGQLFAGAANGTYRWDGTSSWQSIGGGPGNAWIDVDPSGTYWAGNLEGLWRWTGTFWSYARSPGPSGNWVQGMQLSGSTLWTTTRDLGMSRFDGTTWRNYYPNAGATTDTTFFGQGILFGLLADRDGTVWAGQWGQSVAHVNPSEPPVFDHFYDAGEPNFDSRNTFLWSTALDNDGNRYFGYDTPSLGVITPIGINKIATDGTRSNFSPPAQAMSGPQIRSIAFAPGSAFEMWVAYARSGVDVFTDPTLVTRLDHLQETRVVQPGSVVIPGLLNLDTWAIEFNGDDVWIGDSGGLTRWSRSTRRRLEAVTTPAVSTQGAIHPLSIDAEGGVWWATSGGLFHRKPDRSVEVFTAENSPLLSNDVHSVIVDKTTGDVWIGSVLGVNRYNPGGSSGDGTQALDGASFRVYPNPAFQSVTGVVFRTNEIAGPFKGKVYDIHGRVVRELLGNATTGIVWDGLNEFGSRVPPGMYFLNVKVGDVTRKSRVILFR